MRRGPWRLGVLLLPLTLAGCLEDQQQQVAQCTLSASRAHPGAKPPYDYNGVMENDVRLCMRAAGYEANNLGAKMCQPDIYLNSYCYLPTGWVAGLIVSAQIWLASN